MWAAEFAYAPFFLPSSNCQILPGDSMCPMIHPLRRGFRHQIFCFFKTSLKDLLQLGQSKSPMVSSVLFPALSGRPAIFQLFLGLATSAPQFLHLAIPTPLHKIHNLFFNKMNKRFAIHNYL